MAGDPTRTQPQGRRSAAPALQEWYLVTDDGSPALRMTPGLTVGESDSGDLTINEPEPATRWVEFVIANPDEPWATIVTRDKSLRVAGSTCLRHPLQAGATLRLPNNTLHISRDIRPPQRSGTVIEVIHRDIPQPLRDLLGPEWEEARVATGKPQPSVPGLEVPEPLLHTGETRHQPDHDDYREDWSDRSPMMAEARRVHDAARQRRMTVMVGMGGIAAGALAGAVAVLVSMSDREPVILENLDPDPYLTPPVSAPVPSPAPAQPPAAVEIPAPAEAPATEQTVAAEQAFETEPTTLRTALPQPADPATAQGSVQSGQVPAAPAPDRVAPVAVPAVERRETEIPPSADTPAPAPEATADRPDPATLAALEETGLMAQALTTELARRRDLLAADLALAQGRLTTPPETSAYTLYNQVLAADPGSPRARSGLQRVRQGLINRVLAQLAGGNLDQARQTLQAAAASGADPVLVSDLRDEVELRQRRIDGQSE